jgi:hypothetical protein
MQIQCPKCKFTGNIRDDLIPPSGVKNIGCPKCKTRFFAKKTASQEILLDTDVKKLHAITISSAKKKQSVLNRFMSYIQPAEMLERSNSLNTFKQIFKEAVKDGSLTDKEVEYMKMFSEKKGLNWSEAIGAVRAEATNYLNEYVSFAKSDAVIDETEESYINALLDLLGFNPGYVETVRNEINHIKLLENIRKGNLPRVENPSIVLKSSEICHYQTNRCIFYLKGNIEKYDIGQLIITSDRIVFMGNKNFDVSIKQILNINYFSNRFELDSKLQKADGVYEVEDAELASEIILTLIKKSNYHIFENSNLTQTRQIPPEVKRNVWQRDAGKCVYCGAQEYLEFDHIIPHAKGGANTEGNIQLLCRRCNANKRDNI